MELKRWKNAEATEAVVAEARRYDVALWEALKELVKRYPPKHGDAEALWDANAPYLVLMTLQGQGVGIWDGRWDEFYTDTDQVEEFLKDRLRSFSDGTGSGSLENALMDAADETCR